VSGICGLFNLDGAPVTGDEIGAMAALLERRGPERTGTWREGTTSLGHTLLATTPEAMHERLPLVHPETGCTITADVRLDNRGELLGLLGLRERRDLGDAEILLLAYLRWGERCVERFLGDFAFAIWDPRDQKLFCGRDQMGLRPFYYHHSPSRLFAFASEPEAILVLSRVPDRIHEVRIADYLAPGNLESVDRTSTFFAEVERLTPAHALTVTLEGVKPRRYWQLQATDELRLGSHEEYAEAFLDVLTPAVASRMRSPGPVGSMLSGGMDSGSVTAVAASLTAADGRRRPLPTFSAVSPDPSTCIETRTIFAALEMDGLDPRMVRYDQLDEIDGLEALTWKLAEPFDAHMTLVRALYLRASQSGVRVVLDGVGGDTVLEICDFLPRLARSGHWIALRREAEGWNRFRSSPTRPWRDLASTSLAGVAPEPLLHRRRQLGIAREVEDVIQRTGLRREFADRIGLEDRLAAMRGILRVSPTWSYQQRRAHWMSLPHMTAARERYGRVAAAVGVEPRDPFFDLRVMQFAVGLPGDQLLRDGWPKAILRRAMATKLPRAVRDRIGKEHLGIYFTEAIGAMDHDALQARVKPVAHLVAPYVDLDRASLVDRAAPFGTNLYGVVQLAGWLDVHRQRSNGVPHRAGES
jgi:asparagine synthase (glutamine-hydrolysing)